MKRLGALALGFSALAAGCGGSQPGTAGPAGTTTTTVARATSTSSPAGAAATTTTAATATATAATTPVTTAPEQLSGSSRLRIDGIGPIRIGMTIAEARAAAGVPLTLERQPHCDVLTLTGGPDGLALIVTRPATGRIGVITVNRSTFATLSGVRVGDTEAGVLGAYPGRLRPVNAGLPVHRLVYEASDTALADRAVVFVIADGRVASISAGQRADVEADEICA